MPTPEVIERVRVLHDHLAQAQPDSAKAPTVDPIKQQLDTILVEPHNPAVYTSLGDRLRAAVVELETDHPGIAAAMQAALNALNAAGL